MTDNKPDESKAPEHVVLTVVHPFYVSEFVYGDPEGSNHVVVTKHGTEVAASRADRVINAAKKAGVIIEKASK